MRRYTIVQTKSFRKDILRLEKSAYNLTQLQRAIDILESGELLPENYRDHKLKGGMYGYRACHIAPDWLLVYEKDEGKLVLVLFRTGTHRDVLGVE